MNRDPYANGPQFQDSFDFNFNEIVRPMQIGYLSREQKSFCQSNTINLGDLYKHPELAQLNFTVKYQTLKPLVGVTDQGPSSNSKYPKLSSLVRITM